MIQVNFWYGKANKPTKETDKVFIRVNNKSLNFRRSLGWDISLKDWDIKNKKLIDLNKNPKTNEEYQYLKQLQSKLQEVKDVFTDEYRKIAFEKPLTKIEFNDWCSINIKIAKGEDIEEGEEPLFVDLMEKCYKWKLKRKKIGESSVNQYKRHIKKIKDFEEYQIDENKKYKLDRGYYASELSLDFYDQLQDFYNKSKVDKDSPLNNNFKACIKKVKATVNHFKSIDADFKYHPNVNHEDFNGTTESPEHVVLTPTEIDLIYNYTGTKRFENIKDTAIILYYGCFRINELLEQLQIGVENLQIHKQGDKYIWKVAQSKVNRKKSFPVHYRILELYQSNKFPESLTEQAINRGLKDLMRELGIYKGLKITSHTLRRSFCTNQFNDKADIQDIMQFSGHKRENTLMSYIQDENKDRENKISLTD